MCETMRIVKVISLWILGIFFILAGWNHFRSHSTYVAIMPPGLPYKSLLVDISGVAEILGGLGVLVKWTRAAAGAGLILLLIAVFPANIHMALHHVMPGAWRVPVWALWVRLPLQAVLMAWVWWCAISPTSDHGPLRKGSAGAASF